MAALEEALWHLEEPFARQNWATRLDSRGRPVLADTGGVGVQGTPVYPGSKGATNWWSPSYDPALDLVFIPVLEQGMIFFPSANTLPSTGGRQFFTAVRALEAGTGRLVWEHRQEVRSDDSNSSGLLTTRGSVLFAADHGAFFALDSRSGKQLWSVETGGTIYAAPITYTVNGEQFVSVIAGRNLVTFALPR